MSGITDLPFRLVAKTFGASLVYVPLISAKALVLGSKKTFNLLKTDTAEKPVAVQIFGGDPNTIAKAAEILRPYPFDLLDINMGCPAPKVAGHAGGSSLLRAPELAAKVAEAATRTAGKPVTAKIRSGWDERSVNAVELALALEAAGVAALAVHPRTKTQRYSGRSDWSVIRQVKQAVRIPVIGSGDVASPEDAKQMLEATGCDMVMIARAARGNPWIFRRGNVFLEQNELPPEPSPCERLQTLINHCTIMARHENEHSAALMMRKHAGWYIKGLQNAASARDQVNKAASLAEIIRICYELEHRWHETCSP